jgi:hypothetical protein
MAAAKTTGGSDALLRRLERLTRRAIAVKPGDRAELIALVDDLETVRTALSRECARLDDELTLAARRVMAINAYSRNGRAARAPVRRGH